MDELKALLQKDDPLLRPMRVGNHNFPGIWGVMMPRELHGLRFPEERRATCMDCPKACYEGFRADYRCCTYFPRVSNFLLGLASETPAGDKAIDALIERGMLLPEGMHYAPSQWYDYLDDLQNEAFGKSKKVLCPMLDQPTGFCNIHAFRNAVCSTFFCYKDHGKAGESFWDQLQTLGSQIEMALSQWALQAVGFDLNAYFKAFDSLSRGMAQVSGPKGWQKEALAALWGPWRGREKELMRSCAAIVVKNRTRLWEIANTQPIGESKKFDKAMVKAVPKYLHEQIDAEDLEEGGGDTVRPSVIWQDCLKAYWKLWDWPSDSFTLNPKVTIVPNPRKSAEDMYYGNKDYFIEFRPRKQSKAVDWRLGISAEEKQVLKLFDGTEQSLDFSLFEYPEAQSLENIQAFICEMLSRKVIF